MASLITLSLSFCWVAVFNLGQVRNSPCLHNIVTLPILENCGQINRSPPQTTPMVSARKCISHLREAVQLQLCSKDSPLDLRKSINFKGRLTSTVMRCITQRQAMSEFKLLQALYFSFTLFNFYNMHYFYIYTKLLLTLFK
jgi:hypothetical protein